MREFRSWLAASSATLALACVPATPGDVCRGLQPGDLVLTEVMGNPAGSDTGNEYLEFYNTTGEAVDLTGFTLFARSPSGERTQRLRSGGIDGGEYFTFGDVRPPNMNPAWITFSYDDSLSSLPNSGGTVGLRCGMTTLAEFTYPAVDATDSRSFQLSFAATPSAAYAADLANWCFTPEESRYGGTMNAGTPRAPNVVCPGGTGGGGGDGGASMCQDPLTQATRPVVPPQPGDLFFSEVMANPSGTDTDREWVEVSSNRAVDLNGLVLRVAASSTTNTTLTSTTCLAVAAGGQALLARKADSAVNGELPPVLATFNGDISNSAATTLSLLSGSVTLDSWVHTFAQDGVSQQLRPGLARPEDNDVEANRCPAPAGLTYGAGGRGTPGRANDCGGDGGMPDSGVPDSGVPDSGVPDGGMRDAGPQSDAGLVISQVYGGGGNSGASYLNDFVELRNRSGASIDLSGRSLQYASSAGSTWTVLAFDGGAVAAGGYFLVRLAAGSSGAGAALPAFNAEASINLSGSDGKLALVDGVAPLSGTCPLDGGAAGILDFVGYGSASCAEGAAAPGPSSNTVSVVRLELAGTRTACNDSNRNDGDFVTNNFSTSARVPFHAGTTPATCP